MRRLVSGAVLALALLVLGSSAQAAPLSLTLTQGTLSATVTFTVVGGNLQVVLTNSSANDTLVPADVLTGVYRDVAGNPNLSALSADVTAGSSIVAYNDPVLGAGSDVRAEWAYKDGGGTTTSLGGGLSQEFGLSAAGLGV